MGISSLARQHASLLTCARCCPLSLSRFWVLLQEPSATFASIETLVCAASWHSVCILHRSSLPPSQWAKECGIREDMEVKAAIDICGCFGPPGSLHAIQGLMLLSSPALSPLQFFPSMKWSWMFAVKYPLITILFWAMNSIQILICLFVKSWRDLFKDFSQSQRWKVCEIFGHKAGCKTSTERLYDKLQYLCINDIIIIIGSDGK